MWCMQPLAIGRMQRPRAMLDGRNDVRIQALEIYLCCAKASSLRNLYEVENVAILHQYSGHSECKWSTVIQNAKNVVKSVERCTDSCCSFQLAQISKSETAFLWSVEAARAIAHNETEVYRKASYMMLKSQLCVLNALDADRNREFELKRIWLTAADATNEVASLQVFTMLSNPDNATKKDVVLFNHEEISKAKKIAADHTITGNTKRAAHCNSSSRLLSVASALHCLVECEHGYADAFRAAEHKAKLYHTCLKASIKLEGSIPQMRANQGVWAADLLSPFADQLSATLDASELTQGVDALLSGLATAKSRIDSAAHSVAQKQAHLEMCAEKAAKCEPLSPGVAAAWAIAAKRARSELDDLLVAVQSAESVSTLPGHSYCRPMSASEQWASVARSVEHLHQNDLLRTVADCATEQGRLCYSSCASVLRRQLEICASLLSSPENCLCELNRCLPIMTEVKEVVTSYLRDFAPLYETAQRMRTCATEVPELANTLTEAAAWFDQRADQSSQALLSSLPALQPAFGDAASEQACADACTEIKQLRLQNELSPSAHLQGADVVLLLGSAQLKGLLRIYQRLAESPEIGSSAQACVPHSIWKSWEDERKNVNMSNTVLKGERESLETLETLELQKAIAVLRATAAQLKQASHSYGARGMWGYRCYATLCRAASMCTGMAECAQCAIDAAADNDLHLLSECTAAVGAFRLHWLLKPEAQQSSLRLSERATFCITGCKNAGNDAALRQLWRRALFHCLRASVLETAGDTEAAGVVAKQAQQLQDAAELTALVPGFRATGHGGAADLCVYAVQLVRAGRGIPSALQKDMAALHEGLALLYRDRLHCLEKANSCKDHTLKKVWPHIAGVAVYPTAGLVDRFAADPAAVPFDVRSLNQLVGFAVSCVEAAKLLETDVSMLAFCSAKLTSPTPPPQSPTHGTSGIQCCWRNARHNLRNLVDRAAESLLTAVVGTSALTVEVRTIRLLVHRKVHDCMKIAHHFFAPAVYAHRQSTYSRGIVATEGGEGRLVELHGLWEAVAQHFDHTGGALVDVLEGFTDQYYHFPQLLDKWSAAQRKLAQAENLTAALKSSDPRVRDAYYAAYVHSGGAAGAFGSESADLYRELARRLERGAPEGGLQALRAACLYAEGCGPQRNDTMRWAYCAALRAHRLGGEQHVEVARLLCAAKCLSVDTATEHERVVLRQAGQMLLDEANNTHFRHAAAVDLLRLANYGHLTEEFTINASGLPSTARPYAARYAASVLEQLEAQLSIDDSRKVTTGTERTKSHAWTAVAISFGDLCRALCSVAHTDPSGDDLARLNCTELVAERYKKAALALDAGNSELHEAWRLAAEASRPSDAGSANRAEVGQRFADAAEALAAGQQSLHLAMHSAACLLQGHQCTVAGSKQSRRLEMRAADLLVEAARTECTGKYAAGALFRAAAEKVAVAAQRLAAAQGTTKRVADRAKAAAAALLREGDVLQARAVAELAVMAEEEVRA